MTSINTVLEKDSIPGVAYSTPEGEQFYVDVLWAMAIEDRENLDKILQLKQPHLAEKLNELSVGEVMRKAYTVAKYLVDYNETHDNNQTYSNLCGSLIDWYYHSLSPKTVDWQLNHPKINKLFSQIIEKSCDLIISFNGFEILNDEEVLETKKRLRSHKGRSNYVLQKSYLQT